MTATDLLVPAWSNPSLRPDWNGAKAHLATAADGSIVAARGNLILRYLPNGQLDSSFGDAGRVALSSVEGLPFGLADVAIDSEGKVMAFGTTVDPSITREISGYLPVWVNPSFATVLGFDSTGKLDPGFGGGDGIFRSGLGFRSLSDEASSFPLVEVDSATLDSQGRAVMAIGEVGVPPSEGHSYFGWVTNTLARLTPAGDLDRSFGGDGIVEDFVGQNQIYSDFCISARDEPVVASLRFSFSPAIGWLTRLRSNGAPNLSFGGDGTRVVRGGSGPLACESSGRITMLQAPGFARAGRRSPWTVVRFSSDGRANRHYGQSGRARMRLPDESSLTAIEAGGRGTVLLVGNLSLPRRGKARARSFLTVIRLLASGKPDWRFGHGGRTRTGFGRDTAVSAGEATVDASGRLVVAGPGRSPLLQPGGIVMAGYLPGG